MMPKRIKKGFTLAEVLITLTVIGIIAALTIPGLIQSVEAQQNKISFIKNYSAISQAFKQVIEDDGGIFESSAITYTDKIRNKLCGKINCIKKCDIDNMSTYGQCFHTFHLPYLNGTLMGHVYAVDIESAAILPSGALILVYGDRLYDSSYPNLIGDIFIDVNGFKNPNIIGKDIFGIYVDKKIGSIPFGSELVGRNISSCNTAGNGLSCASKILMNSNY